MLVPRCTDVNLMAPTQATEAIVDAAVAHKTPFAIVPCCVFSRRFPRLLGSTPVRSLPQFVAYLRAKSGSAVTVDLAFEGPSVVVFDFARLAVGHEQCVPCDDESTAVAVAAAASRRGLVRYQ